MFHRDGIVYTTLSVVIQSAHLHVVVIWLFFFISFIIENAKGWRPPSWYFKLFIQCGNRATKIFIVSCKTCTQYLYSKSQCPSQWARGLSRGSAAAHLLGLWFESLRRHGYLSLVSVVCCQVEVSATDRSFVQRSLTERARACVRVYHWVW